SCKSGKGRPSAPPGVWEVAAARGAAGRPGHGIRRGGRPAARIFAGFRSTRPTGGADTTRSQERRGTTGPHPSGRPVRPDGGKLPGLPRVVRCRRRTGGSHGLGSSQLLAPGRGGGAGGVRGRLHPAV